MNAKNSDIMDMLLPPTLDHYQEQAVKTAVYPGQGSALGLIYTALKLNGEAGEFAENVGKAMRDDKLIPVSQGANEDPPFHLVAHLNGELTPERHQKLVNELGDVLWYVASTARELGVPLRFVAEENLKKLKSRQERGKIQGSGDNR